ncbi:hypothetical protein HYW87_04810 [Candidatus Roizmanbacteria bacterium]|nr:hypothetical protein [Candidatus Roizmanbacteria bacterium]
MSKPKGVLYIDRNHIDLFENISKKLVSLDIPSNVIKDLEVTNYQALHILISTFLKQNRIIPIHLVSVASSNVLFEKTLQGIADEQKESTLRNFVDLLPFDRVSFRAFTSQKETKVVAMNSDLFHAFKNIFEENGFRLSLILPESVIESLRGKTHLDQSSALFILESYEKLKLSNLAQQTQFEKQPLIEKYLPQQSRLLPALLAVFFLLLGALSTLFITSGMNKRMTTTTSATQISPAPTNVASLSATIVPKPLTAQILYTSTTATISAEIKQILRQNNISSVEEDPNSSIVTQEPLALFSSAFPKESRTSLEKALKNILPNISFQETTEPRYDILIQVGKRNSP